MSVAQTTATAEAAAATTTTAASTDTSHRFSCCLNLSEWKPTDPPIATTAPWTFGRNQPAGMSPRRRRRRRDANFSSLVLPTSYARFFSEFIYFIFYFLFLWFFLFNQPARCNFHFTCDFPGLQCDLQLNKSEIIWAHGSQCVNITIESFIQSRWTIAFCDPAATDLVLTNSLSHQFNLHPGLPGFDADVDRRIWLRPMRYTNAMHQVFFSSVHFNPGYTPFLRLRQIM